MNCAWSKLYLQWTKSQSNIPLFIPLPFCIRCKTKPINLLYLFLLTCIFLIITIYYIASLMIRDVFTDFVRKKSHRIWSALRSFYCFSLSHMFQKSCASTFSVLIVNFRELSEYVKCLVHIILKPIKLIFKLDLSRACHPAQKKPT